MLLLLVPLHLVFPHRVCVFSDTPGSTGGLKREFFLPTVAKRLLIGDHGIAEVISLMNKLIFSMGTVYKATHLRFFYN